MRSRVFAAIAAACSAGLVFTALAVPQLAGTASAKGAPIKLLMINQTTDPSQGQPVPETAAAAQAAVKTINAAGGLYGHLLQLTVCNDGDVESTSTNCARQAVSNNVVATIGDNTQYGTADDPILLNANIANIGLNPLTGADFMTANGYPVSPGAPAVIAGEALALANAGAKKISVARVDNPAAAEVDALANLALAAKGMKILQDVPVPTTAPDLSTYVADVTANGADGILIAMNANQGAQFIEALHQGGVHIPIAVDSSGVPPPTLKKLGSVANGLLVSNTFRPLSEGGPGATAFLKGMKKYAPNAEIDDFSVNGWLAVQEFVGIVKQAHLTNITNVTVLAAAKATRNLNLGGLVPPWSAVAGFPALPQVFNLGATLGKVKNGKVVALSNQFSYPLPGTGPSAATTTPST